jgi:hypothetical protein
MTNLISRGRLAAIASAAVLALTAAACPRAGGPSHPSAPQTGGAQITGTWLHRQMPVRYAEAMTLRTHADSVLGEGTYMMEAGRSGNTTIVGTWHHSGAVTLDILRDTGVRERWSGTLRGDTLAGTLTIADAGAQPFDYVRQP